MQPISEAIQEDILDKLHYQICNWSKAEVLSSLGKTEEELQFITQNKYISYHHQSILSDLKDNIRKKNLDLVDDSVEPKVLKKKAKDNIYQLKGCNKHKNFTVFELMIDAPSGKTDINHAVQQNDFVILSASLEERKKECYLFGIIHTLKEGLLLIKTLIP